MNVNEQIQQAVLLRQGLMQTWNQLAHALDNHNDAQSNARAAAEELALAENNVKATAAMSGDQRLPKATTSAAYKAAMESIVAEAHHGDIASEFEERNQTRETAAARAVDLESLKLRLGAQKAAANLQAAVLNALASTESTESR